MAEETAALPPRDLEETIAFLTNGYYGIYRRWLLSDSAEDPEYIAALSERLSTACFTALWNPPVA